MGADLLKDTLARLATVRRITPEDALDVRRAIYADANLTPLEAETLIALDEAALERCAEWDTLFAEALTDYVVHQQHPAGYVDEAGADWVIAMLGRDGHIRTDSELELLVHILEAADSVPCKLVDFALAQVKDAVVNGEGPLARSGHLKQGCVTVDEVSLLRRIIYAAAGDGNVAITRSEAEALIDINDAVSGAANNDPSWNDLFAKAISAAVMTVSGYHAVSREDAARREAWLTEKASLGGFFSRMFGSGNRWGPDGTLSEWEAHNRSVEASIAAAEPISRDEAAWLADRIGRDGVFDAAEKTLIAFLREESPLIDPSLQAVITEAAEEPEKATPATFGKRMSSAG